MRDVGGVGGGLDQGQRKWGGCGASEWGMEDRGWDWERDRDIQMNAKIWYGEGAGGTLYCSYSLLYGSRLYVEIYVYFRRQTVCVVKGAAQHPPQDVQYRSFSR